MISQNEKLADLYMEAVYGRDAYNPCSGYNPENVFQAYIAGLAYNQKELDQQRFNNEHNLSIDQTVSDKIEDLEENKENLIRMFDQRTRDYEWKDTEYKLLEDKYTHLLEKIARMSELTYRYDGNHKAWKKFEEDYN